MHDQFLLRDDVHFLNHGSFGATPRPVFEEYQAWQRRLEAQPVQFIGRDLPGLLAEARAALGDYVGAAADDVVYIPNATYGLNVVARSLDFGPGDEVLTTDHEYGACDRTWTFLSQKRGFDIIRQHIPLPAASDEAIADQLWAGVTPRTRAVYLSHITSLTALRLPVEMIVRRANDAGILTIIDGAHAPGQLPLSLEQMGVDFYFGNAHKWLCAPKGAAFLYARRERQSLIEPLVVSWGWGKERGVNTGSDFLDYVQWTGTNDLSAYLAVPAAIRFQAENNWEQVRANCHVLVTQALARIQALTGLPAVYHDDSQYGQLAVAALPPLTDVGELQAWLLKEHHIEIPVLAWRDWRFVRPSVQAYNNQADIDALLAALEVHLAD